MSENNKTKIHILLELFKHEHPELEDGFDLFQSKEKSENLFQGFERIRPSIFVRNYKKEKELLTNLYGVVDGIGSKFLKNYLNISPSKWFVFNKDSSLNDIVNFKKKIEKEDLFLAIGGGFIQDIGKYLQYKIKKKCICLPTALSTHVYGSIHITKHKIFDLDTTSTSIKANCAYATWIDYSFLRLINKINPNLMSNGISDVYALKSATEEWKISPAFKGNQSDLATLLLSKYSISLLHKCVNFKCIESLVLAQALLNLITEIKGSAPASGSEHLYASVMENKFLSSEPHGVLVAKGILFQNALSPFKKTMHVEKEMKALGIFPYSEKESKIYILDKDIRFEMIKLSKSKKRFSYLELLNKDID